MEYQEVLGQLLGTKADGTTKKIAVDDNGNFILSLTEVPNIITGVATGGSITTLVDSSKNIEADSLNNKLIKFELDDIEFIRKITSSIGNQVGFTTTISPIGAVALVGSGVDEGQIEVTCIGDITGEAGNDYSIEIVQGTATTGDDLIVLNVETKILTITINLNGMGEPREAMAGNIEALINNTSGISDLFHVEDDFSVGSIPMTTEPVLFENGVDGLPVISGTSYVIF